MNSQMRTFSREVESRLDKVYTKGAGKKYGYDDITNQSMAQVSLPGSSSESRYEDRMLKKIQNQAQSFLDQGSLNASTISSKLNTSSANNVSSMSNLSITSGGPVKAILPPMNMLQKGGFPNPGVVSVGGTEHHIGGPTSGPALRVKRKQPGSSSVKRSNE